MFTYRSSRILHDVSILRIRDLIEYIKIGRIEFIPVIGSLRKKSILKKSHIIESIISGLPLDAIWAESSSFGKIQLLSSSEIVDTIYDFQQNKLQLKDLRILKHLEGLTYSELQFVEQKHFMQMELALNIISHDSNPLLKCIFIEDLNSKQYGSYAGQLARNIVFKETDKKISKLLDAVAHYNNYFSKDIKINKFVRLERQTDIIDLLLIIYWKERNDTKVSVAMESYSYTRSFLINDMNDYFKINDYDTLKNARNKVALILEENKYFLNSEMQYLRNFLEPNFFRVGLRGTPEYTIKKYLEMREDGYSFSDNIDINEFILRISN